MTDRLLRKGDIAAMFGTSSKVAASILKEHGCNAIDVGYGRGRGLRWLESAAVAVLHKMNAKAAEAKPAPKTPKIKRDPDIPELGIANMRASALHAILTQGAPLQ